MAREKSCKIYVASFWYLRRDASYLRSYIAVSHSKIWAMVAIPGYHCPLPPTCRRMLNSSAATDVIADTVARTVVKRPILECFRRCCDATSCVDTRSALYTRAMPMSSDVRSEMSYGSCVPSGQLDKDVCGAARTRGPQWTTDRLLRISDFTATMMQRKHCSIAPLLCVS